MEQLGSHWTDLYAIWYLSIFWKPAEKNQVSLQSEKNNVVFKWINQVDAVINYRFIVCRLNNAQHVSGILMSIIRSLSTAAAASGLPIAIRDTVL